MSGSSPIFLAGLLLVVGLWIWWTYNRLVGARNLTRAAWSDIDVQLQRRHDLIPRLVETVKAYAGYERTALEAVVALRERSRLVEGRPEKAAIEEEIGSATKELIALAESYPELKADRNFRDLQEALAETEDQLQYARRFYNGAVRDYNTRLQSFPDLIPARVLRFRSREYFDAEARAEAPIRVQLD